MHSDSFLSKKFLILKLFSALYVLGIVISHAALPSAYIWQIAAFFSIAMNFTYPFFAIITKTFIKTELFLSTTFIALTIIGLLSAPQLIILAIFAHGVWDLFKCCGMGIKFFRWYVNGCVLVDWFYALTLLIYLMT